jgi:hypothetical protein
MVVARVASHIAAATRLSPAMGLRFLSAVARVRRVEVSAATTDAAAASRGRFLSAVMPRLCHRLMRSTLGILSVSARGTARSARTETWSEGAWGAFEEALEAVPDGLVLAVAVARDEWAEQLQRAARLQLPAPLHAGAVAHGLE